METGQNLKINLVFCLSKSFLYLRRYPRYGLWPLTISSIFFMWKLNILLLKSLVRIRIRIRNRICTEIKSWIRIRIETKADPQNCEYYQYFMPGYTHTSWSSDSLMRSTTCARRVRSGLDLAVRLGKSHTRRFSRPSHRRGIRAQSINENLKNVNIQ